MKSRGVYETPGGTLLYHAHRAVESLTLDREVAHLRDELSNRYAEMVYNGFWFAPEREALQSFMDDVQKPVTGEARLKLYKGQAIVEGRRSDSHDLYDEATVTFEADDVYNQSDAEGFIRLQSLRLRTFAEKRFGRRGGEHQMTDIRYQVSGRDKNPDDELIAGSISASALMTVCLSALVSGSVYGVRP